MRNLGEEIVPIRIQRLDERQLLRSRSAFDLLLAGNGFRHRSMELEPNQQLAAISLREAVKGAFPMLPGAMDEAGRYAGI